MAHRSQNEGYGPERRVRAVLCGGGYTGSTGSTGSQISGKKRSQSPNQGDQRKQAKNLKVKHLLQSVLIGLWLIKKS